MMEKPRNTALKPALEFLPRDAEESFVVKDFDYAWYPTPWHFHPEYEIVLVTESTGTRFIGERISNYKPGNLALIGSNLPHLYRSDAIYYKGKKSLRARSIVVHFSDASFGQGFLQLPETKKISLMLQRSRLGIEVTGKTNLVISSMLHELLQLQGVKKLLKLLEILAALAEIKNPQTISGEKITGVNEQESERMNAVLDFLMKNFSEDISRADAARIAHMSENAFSRYFSQRTRKTFAQYLNELRLSHASRLLIEKELPVASVSYACGFNNLSNFNRFFKRMYTCTPLQYRKTYWNEI